MRTWEEAKIMELNINETAASAENNAKCGWLLDWLIPGIGNHKPGNHKPGNNGGCGNSGSTDSVGGTGSDSSDSFVDSLS